MKGPVRQGAGYVGAPQFPFPPLAKREGGSGDRIPLHRHLQDVAAYADALWKAWAPVLDGLLGREASRALREALQVAALVHDFGKAATGFQAQLLGRARPWEFRHEILSTAWLLAAAGPVDVALLTGGSTQGDGVDRGMCLALAVAAVLTHHRACDDPQLNDDAGHLILPDPEALDVALKKFAARVQEMQPYWEWLHEFARGNAYLSKFEPPASPAALRPPGDWLAALRDIAGSLEVTEGPGLMLALARGWLMAADHAASAGVEEFPSFKEPERLPLLRGFQEAAGACHGDLLLEAPTGSGKTIAALQWIARNRRGGERVFYLLPYQASIEAMQRTMRGLLGSGQVAALHARALDYLFAEYFEGAGEYAAAAKTARREWDLARLVYRPFKVATPYQLIKWFFGVRRFEIGLSEMLGGLFVFDEIHAYDAHTAALILETVRVLKKLGGRFLFMSATFPDFLKEHIIGALQAGQPAGASGPGYVSIETGESDPWARQFLSVARHRLHWVDQPLDSLCRRIAKEVEAGRRVLVVANRVAQAQAIYEQVQKVLGGGAVLLHSRFTREDRAEKERKVVAALQGGVGAGGNQRRDAAVRALVATQVVEVSLDISFDVMFTEVAPVDDLLQRMGRVNRYGELGEPADIYICTEFDRERLKWVYDLERIEATLAHGPPDGGALTAAMAGEWVRRVYQGGWTAKEQRQFDQARQSYLSVLQGLRPLHANDTQEEQFYTLFSGVEALPAGLQEAYLRHMDEGQYLLASRLLVPVTLGLFHALRRKGRVSPQRGGPPVVHVPYDSEYGLQPDAEPEGGAWLA